MWVPVYPCGRLSSLERELRISDLEPNDGSHVFEIQLGKYTPVSSTSQELTGKFLFFSGCIICRFPVDRSYGTVTRRRRTLPQS